MNQDEEEGTISKMMKLGIREIVTNTEGLSADLLMKKKGTTRNFDIQHKIIDIID